MPRLFTPKGVDQAWLARELALRLPTDVKARQAARDADERVRREEMTVRHRDLDGKAVLKETLNRYVGAWRRCFDDPSTRPTEIALLRARHRQTTNDRTISDALSTFKPPQTAQIEVYLLRTFVEYSEAQVAQVMRLSREAVRALHVQAERAIEAYVRARANRRGPFDVR